MKLPRRKLLQLAVGAAALPAVLRFAFAQSYPSQPVRMIVGFPAGQARTLNPASCARFAVTATKRSEALPDTPTIAEFVRGYDASGYFGFGAPSRTPKDIIDKLNTEIKAIVVDPRIKEKLVSLGIEPMQLTSAEYGKLIVAETEKWTKVVKAAGMKAD